MQQYLKLLEKASRGNTKSNRTGVDHIGYFGDMCQYDMADGFPVVTTRKVPWKSAIGEMIGFIRGYSNADDFAKLGCKWWYANANDNNQWLNNPNRKGENDLGRIYGVQARRWKTYDELRQPSHIDQLKNVIVDLKNGIDNRREIVIHWNPAETAKMALPPCHLMYQFSIQNNKLDLLMYQRSCDVPLGIPANIIQYSFLLMIVSQIVGIEAGVFTHMLGDVHIYENQLDNIEKQLSRTPLPLPTLQINPDIKSLNDLETWVTIDDFSLNDYTYHDPINYPFAV